MKRKNPWTTKEIEDICYLLTQFLGYWWKRLQRQGSWRQDAAGQTPAQGVKQCRLLYGPACWAPQHPPWDSSSCSLAPLCMLGCPWPTSIHMCIQILFWWLDQPLCTNTENLRGSDSSDLLCDLYFLTSMEQWLVINTLEILQSFDKIIIVKIQMNCVVI